MASKILEKQVEKRLQKKVKEIGGIAYKFISPGNSGVPDRIVVYDGRTYFIELKRPGGVLTSLQHFQIEKLRRTGQDVRVLYNFDEVDCFVEELKAGETC